MRMKFNLGDKVKFMDQEGQGVVSRIINASTVGVTVDGFELPFSITDLLKVEKPSSTAERLFYEGKATYGTPRQEARERQKSALPGDGSFPGDESPETETGSETGESAAASPEPEKEPDDRISALSRGFTSKQPQPEGIYIGLVPLDQQFMLRGPVEFLIINYTPYTLIYNLAIQGAETFSGADYASVPPYSKIFVESIEREDLGLWAEGLLQCLFYQDESRAWLQPSSNRYKIKASQLGNAENYRYPVFMREKALLVPLLELSVHKAENTLPHPSSGKKETDSNGKKTCGPVAAGTANPLARYMLGKDVAEVDLHAESLKETRLEFKGASEDEYLGKQLSVFETCLNQAINGNLSKIIFIHGVGNGILKHEIEKRLKEYSGVHYMDASSAKYGRGAIEVYLDTRDTRKHA